jgi:hypothetical protein
LNICSVCGSSIYPPSNFLDLHPEASSI